MNRIDRLQAILIQLQTKKIVKAHEIAERFNISLRTVYRDIRALEAGGIPIGAEAGIGYFLDESYSLPPVMFTTNEAIALLFAGKLIPAVADTHVNESYQAALYKIKSVLNTNDKQSLQKLENNIKVYSSLSQQHQTNTLFLLDIQRALIHSKVVQIQYFSQYNQQNSHRDVEPIALIYYGMNWHLIAWCTLRMAYRDFRLNRIQSLNVTNQTYARIPDKSFDEYLKSQNEQTEYVEIKLKVSKILASLVLESKYWYGFLHQTEFDNEVQMSFLNSDLNAFARWVITLGTDASIVEPTELYSIVKTMVNDISKKYN